MMKKIFLILFLLASAASFAFAQLSENGTIENMMDLSLEGLKDSYQKLVDQNRLLTSEVKGYRDHVRPLQQELDSLESQKMKLSVIFDVEEKAGVEIYRQEIERLMNKLDSASESAIDKAFQQKKNELEAALEQSRKSLRAVQSGVNKHRAGSTGMISAVAQQRARQAQLQRQLADRRVGLDLGSAKGYAHQLDKEIARLKWREKALEKKLSQAPNEEKNNISGFTEESYRLRRRFVALHDENMRLKREVFNLGAISASQ